MASTSITHHEATANGIRLHYARAGEGPPVLLLHGWPEFWYGWRATMPALAEAGFTAIAPDLRGFGTSEKPPDGGYDKRTVAIDVYELMRGLGFERFAVVGHDWGGAVADWVLLDYPENVTKFCIMNMVYMPGMFAEGATMPAPDPDVIAQSWYQHFHRLPNHVAERLVEGREDVYLGHIIETWTATPGAFTAADLAAYTKAYREPGALTGGFNYYREMGDIMLIAGHAATRPPQPTLVIWGMDDPVIRPAGIEAYERCFPNLTVVRIDGCGHFPQWERPDVVNEALIGFLKG